MSAQQTASRRPNRLRALCVLLVVAGVIVGANLLGEYLAVLLEVEVTPRNEYIVHRLVMISAAAYVVLIAIPFVPGVEIALSLMMVFGPKIVVLMYACTLLGLSLGFMVGRHIPVRVLQKFLHDLGLRRAAAFLGEVDAMDEAHRLDLLVARAPGAWVPFLLRFRYLAVALALNIPGNSLIGGGGGIVFIAGVSRLFSPLYFVATLAIAISPVPLAVLIFGERFMPGIL